MVLKAYTEYYIRKDQIPLLNCYWGSTWQVCIIDIFFCAFELPKFKAV